MVMIHALATDDDCAHPYDDHDRLTDLHVVTVVGHGNKVYKATQLFCK